MANAMPATKTPVAPAIMEYKFVLTGPRYVFGEDDKVSARSTLTFYLRTDDGFTPEGSATLIAQIRKELSSAFGYINVSPWEPGHQISRTYGSWEDFDLACETVAAFIRRHGFS